MNQRALTWFDLSGTIHHLVRGDVVQHEGHSLGCVHAGWHRNEFTLRQANELRVTPVDWHRGNHLTWFHSGDTVAKPVHLADQIPAGCERRRRRFGMSTLAGP